MEDSNSTTSSSSNPLKKEVTKKKSASSTSSVQKSRAKRNEQLAEHIELAIEEVMEGYPDCGISLETDYRGYTTTLSVRIHKDKAGGIIKRIVYRRKRPA